MNINGLSKHKLPVLLTYIEKKNIDVLSLQDTRLDKIDSKLIIAYKKAYIAYKMVTAAPKSLLGLQDKSENLIARIKKNIL